MDRWVDKLADMTKLSAALQMLQKGSKKYTRFEPADYKTNTVTI
jgi:hypothetical protein